MVSHSMKAIMHAIDYCFFSSFEYIHSMPNLKNYDNIINYWPYPSPPGKIKNIISWSKQIVIPTIILASIIVFTRDCNTESIFDHHA